MQSIGIIYKIYSLITNDVYIGSTSRDLLTRIGEHKRKNNCKSQIIIQQGEGNYSFEVIKIISLADYHINAPDDFEISQYIKFVERTYQEAYRSMREINVVNKNKALLFDHEKQFYNENWRVDNIERCQQADRERVNCPCGGTIKKNYPSGHLDKHKGHAKYMEKWDNQVDFHIFANQAKFGINETRKVDYPLPMDIIELLDIQLYDQNAWERLKNDLMHNYIQRLIRYEKGYRNMSGMREYF